MFFCAGVKPAKERGDTWTEENELHTLQSWLCVCALSICLLYRWSKSISPGVFVISQASNSEYSGSQKVLAIVGHSESILIDELHGLKEFPDSILDETPM